MEPDQSQFLHSGNPSLAKTTPFHFATASFLILPLIHMWKIQFIFITSDARGGLLANFRDGGQKSARMRRLLRVFDSDLIAVIAQSTLPLRAFLFG